MANTSSLRVPFTGVDSLMHALDEPRRPQNIELEVAVSERLDEPRLREAVSSAAARHPMARARQLPAKPLDLEYAWEIEGAPRRDPVESCATAGSAQLDAARDAFFSRHIDLEAGPPFRLLLVHEEHEGGRVMLSVNHSAFDGVGSLRLLQSISRCYAGEADPLPDVDALQARGFLEEQNRRLRRGPAARSGSPLDLGPPPARLACKPSETGTGFRILHLDLDAADAASRGDATVNDVLLVALHRTIDRWNRSQGVACGRVTVMMPVNQRPAAWRDQVLANLVLPGRVESTRAERSGTGNLLAAVSAQTKRIKTQGVGGTTDPMPRRSPVVFRRLLPHLIDAVAGRMADTAVLSNLGRVEDPPWFGAKGRGLWFGPPPRSPVVLTLGAATVEERLGISLRWCAGALSTSAVREFADLFLLALSELRAAQPGRSG